jgi:hypothetical protein
MESPPKKRGACCSHAPNPTKTHLNSPQNNSGRVILQASEQMLREIQTLRAMQAPFGFVFWFFEQRITRLADEIERLQS